MSKRWRPNSNNTKDVTIKVRLTRKELGRNIPNERKNDHEKGSEAGRNLGGFYMSFNGFYIEFSEEGS